MGDGFSMIFGIIWIIVLISIFSRIAQKSRQSSNRVNPQQQREREIQQMALAQQQRNAQTASSGSGAKPTFRSVPGSTYGTTRNVQQTGTTASRNSGYGQGAFAPVNTSSKISTTKRKDTVKGMGFGPAQVNHITANPVLFEDRRNDWLAKQLREEAAIKRRGSIYDLGASHDSLCEADYIKKEHAKRHNSNGLNRQTFR